VAVADRDHRDGPEVVDDREREQEDLEPGGHAGAEHGERRHREGDVGRHRHAPARDRRPAGVQRRVERRRREHAAERTEDRQHRALAGRELAVHELVLDLHPHQEEEDHHQPVVHPLLERERELRLAEREREFRVPERCVAGAEGRVGPDEGREGGEEQQDRARRLDREEALEGRGEPVGERRRLGAHAAGSQIASSPVMCLPRISVCTSCVPS
jgi:hypothetical protein